MPDGPWGLPDGWRWVRLRDVATRKSRTVTPVDAPNRQFNYLGLENISPGQWDEPQENMVPGSAVRSACVVFAPGQVLYGKLRPYLNKVVLCSRQGIATTELVPLAVARDAISPDYLAAFLRSPWFVDYASSHTTGSRMPRVALDDFWAAPIPLPPLPDQRRIVGKIEALFERIREAKRLQAEAGKQAEQLVEAALDEAFPRPGGGLPKGWRWGTVGEAAAEIQCGFAHGKKRATGGDLLHLRPYNIGLDGEIALEKRFLIPQQLAPMNLRFLLPGDVLFNNTNSVELVGKTGLVREHMVAAFSNHLTRIRASDSLCLGGWLALWLRRLWRLGFFAARCNKWIGQAGYNSAALGATPVPLAPLSVQRAIVDHLSRVRSLSSGLAAAQEASAAGLERLEQSVLDMAFRGEL